jgi:hypothetical protein
MKKIPVTLLLLFSMFLAFGQKEKKDQVYLKSGSLIKGQLITYDAETVKINSAGNSWVFHTSEVDSVVRHEEKKVKFETGKSMKYFFDTSLGVLVGNSANSHDAPLSFMTSMNYRIMEKLYLGAGLGADFLEESYMPSFGQIQYKFRETRFTPFVNMQVGYMVPLEDGTRYQYNYYPYYSSYYPGPQNNQKLNAEGGIFFNPSIGFQFFSSENFGWFFSFGYRHHQLNFSGENAYKLESNYSRLSLKIGFIFN